MSSRIQMTDLGNAQRLVARHGKIIRFCPDWKKWLIWDGKRWVTDRSNEVMRKAKDTVRAMYREAAKSGNDDYRKALVDHARASENATRLRNMITLAESEAGIPVTADSFDRDLLDVNCWSGTLGLQGGKLRQHSAQDLNAKIAPVYWNPETECPLWQGFLKRIMNGDVEKIRYLQRAIGYGLTGQTNEQVVFLLLGQGANGKSVLLETICTILGDYAAHTPTESLLAKRPESIPNDLARLVGKRIVVAVESEEGRKLASARIKQLTGGDTVTARFLYGEYFEFVPRFKIFLATNHRPIIPDTTHAIWRRIHLIPFEVRIPEEERDKQLSEKLLCEASGIFNWIVEGCLEWQRIGLAPPKEIQDATHEYRNEMDVLQSFLDERCQLDPNGRVEAQVLTVEYGQWCQRNHERVLSRREFVSRMLEKGLVRVRSGEGGRWEWHGIQLGS